MEKFNISIDKNELDETQKKVEKLNTLLKEANSLADELAHKIKITICTKKSNSR